MVERSPAKHHGFCGGLVSDFPARFSKENGSQKSVQCHWSCSRVGGDSQEHSAQPSAPSLVMALRLRLQTSSRPSPLAAESLALRGGLARPPPRGLPLVNGFATCFLGCAVRIMYVRSLYVSYMYVSFRLSCLSCFHSLSSSKFQQSRLRAGPISCFWGF